MPIRPVKPENTPATTAGKPPVRSRSRPSTQSNGKPSADHQLPDQDLTATDIAMLEELQRMLLAEEELAK